MRKEGKLESMQGRKKGWMHLGADLLGADLQLLEALAKAAVWGQWCHSTQWHRVLARTVL